MAAGQRGCRAAPLPFKAGQSLRNHCLCNVAFEGLISSVGVACLHEGFVGPEPLQSYFVQEKGWTFQCAEDFTLYCCPIMYVEPTQDFKAGIGTWQCQCFHIDQFNELLRSINDCGMRPRQLASTHLSLRKVSIHLK